MQTEQMRLVMREFQNSKALESVRQFEAKSTPILSDSFLAMCWRYGIGIFLIEKVVNAGGHFQIIGDLATEQSGVGYKEPWVVPAADRLGASRILEFDSGMNFLFKKWHDKIQLRQMPWRVAEFLTRLVILSVLNGVTRARNETVVESAFKFHFQTVSRSCIVVFENEKSVGGIDLLAD